MPLSALLLVLLAAVLHASWNIVAKRAGGDQRFTLLTSLMTSVIWLPAGLWFGWDEVPRWGLLEWGVMATSAVVAPAVLQRAAHRLPRRRPHGGLPAGAWQRAADHRCGGGAAAG
jgi:drug/metabolite transporter (DMT)-like permease